MATRCSHHWLYFFRIVSFWGGLLFTADSFGRVYDNYRADDPKGAFCSTIGGACAADTDLENGFFQNPAALSARGPDWNFDGDYNTSSNLEPGMKGSNTVNETQFLGGAGVAGPRWGFAFGFYGRINSVQSSVTVTNAQQVPQKLNLDSKGSRFEVNFPISCRINSRMSIGVSAFVDFFQQSIRIAGSDSNNSGYHESIGLSSGVSYRINPSLVYGGWFRTPTNTYNSLDFQTIALGTTILNYHEDFALHNPWRVSQGLAWSPEGDKRTLLFDLDLIGTTVNGYLLTYDTFSTASGDRGLTPKGRHLTLEPRLGYRVPWSTTSKGTFLMGTYYEPSRWNDLPGRLHGTGGIAYQAFDIIELMAGADIAKDFFQLFITFR